MNASTRAGSEADNNYRMEVLGYVHLKGLGKPTQEVVDGVRKELQDLSDQDTPSEALSVSAKGGPRCDQFMGHGIDMRTTVKQYIRHLLFVRQGPRSVLLGRSQQGRAHMKKDRAVGIFKVAPGRGPIQFRISLPGTALEESVTTISLREDELLFVVGTVTVAIDTKDTALIWDGYSALPVDKEDSKNTDVLDFVGKEFIELYRQLGI